MRLKPPYISKASRAMLYVVLFCRATMLRQGLLFTGSPIVMRLTTCLRSALPRTTTCFHVQPVSTSCSLNAVLHWQYSVWYQIPQYLLIGIGEILTAITTYDLFYSQVLLLLLNNFTHSLFIILSCYTSQTSD